MSTEALSARFRALRLSMLALMATLTRESDDQTYKKVEHRWYYYKRVVTEAATEPGDARRVLGEIFDEPAWRNFSLVRNLRFHRSERFLERKRAYDRERYAEKLKASRSTPEYREKARLRKQAERRAARERGNAA